MKAHRPSLRARLAVAFWAFASAGCGAPRTPVDAEIEKSPPGVVTVVDFVDYQCHFCKQLHPVLADLLDAHPGRVRVVLKHAPLPEHKGGPRAAAAVVCAEAQGKELAMHDGVMRAGTTSDEALESVAQGLGLDLARWQACRTSGQTAERVRSDTAEWEAMGGDGLPMVFIGRRKIVGLEDIEVLERALLEELDAAR